MLVTVATRSGLRFTFDDGGVGRQPCAPDGSQNRGRIGRRFVKRHLHVSVDQVELDGANRRIGCQRTADQRGFVRAVHPMHVQPELGHLSIMAASPVGSWMADSPRLSEGRSPPARGRRGADAHHEGCAPRGRPLAFGSQ